MNQLFFVTQHTSVNKTIFESQVKNEKNKTVRNEDLKPNSGSLVTDPWARWANRPIKRFMKVFLWGFFTSPLLMSPYFTWTISDVTLLSALPLRPGRARLIKRQWNYRIVGEVWQCDSVTMSQTAHHRPIITPQKLCHQKSAFGLQSIDLLYLV